MTSIAVGSSVRIGADVGVVVEVTGSYARVAIPSGRITAPIADLEPAESEPGDLLVAGDLSDTVRYNLRIEAEFLRHAFRFDPLAGLSNARVEPKHHQVFVAHRVTRKYAPRMILADEVGLGKTIEAGLILKELRAREAARRTLIVAPANLTTQWQRELRVKFNEEFLLLDGAASKHLGRAGANPFASNDSIICSLPFVARAEPQRQILELPWDLVIFDEAHRVRLNREKPTKAYELAHALREAVGGMLLLTATPLQLHIRELWGLIDLVEPGLYPSWEHFERERRGLPALNELMRRILEWPALTGAEQAEATDLYRRHVQSERVDGEVLTALEDAESREKALDRVSATHPLAEVLIRNRRAEVGGFMPRTARTILVDLEPEEEWAQEAVSTYLRETYGAADGGANALGFLLVSYQKMLSSSTAAIHASLTRRRDKLRKALEARREAERWEAGAAEGPSVDERRDAVEVDAVLDDLEALSSPTLLLATEVAELDELTRRLGRIRDSKARELIRAVDTILSADPTEKVLIFTQFRQTQRLLVEALKHRGFTVEQFHGAMGVEAKDAAVDAFRRRSQVLVSTEAGGEGRNLQFCHLVFNYDLPWNPMRIEQRIGRVDRIGQEREVQIVNLANRGTVEERVLEVLTDRIRIFEESVGALDPILGEVEQQLEALALLPSGERDRRIDELGLDLQRQIRQAEVAQEVFRDFALERNSFRYDEAARLLGERPMADAMDLRAFVARALRYEGGHLAEEVDGRDAITLSPALATRLKARVKSLHGTFVPGEAIREESWDFFALGHPIVDGLLSQQRDGANGRAGVRGLADAPDPVGVEVFHEIEVQGLRNEGLLVRHVIGEDLEVTEEVVRRPTIGVEVHDSPPVPVWASDAVARSEHRARALLDEIRAASEVGFEELRRQRLERADRLAAYRIHQQQAIIDRLAVQIAQMEESGTAEQRRVIPAWRGRIEQARARITTIEQERLEERAAISDQRLVATLRTVSAGLVVPG